MHHFLSYAREDGDELASLFCQELDSVPPGARIWMDAPEIRGGQAWEHTIRKAIRGCKKFLFIVTKDSVRIDSYCHKELEIAQELNKPIIPIIRDDTVGYPGELSKLHCIDCSRPENLLHAINALRLALESNGGPIIVNQPPLETARGFHGREREIRDIQDFLDNDNCCLLTVHGRRGSGKTTTTYHALKPFIESHDFDDSDETAIYGVVFLTIERSMPACWNEIFSEMSKVLPEEDRTNITDILHKPEISVENKIQKFIDILSQRKIVAILDVFGQMIDQTEGTLRDPGLNQALQKLLETHGHRVKIILTSERPIKGLSLIQPSRHTRLDLEDGLTSSDAEQMLRDLDYDGSIGFQTQDTNSIKEICSRTMGNPLALQILVEVLREDRNIGLSDVLRNTKNLLPQGVLEVLIGNAFKNLDRNGQLILQAIAVYQQPITKEAIDFMLAQHLDAEEVSPILGSLVNRRLVQKSQDVYSLHRPEQSYVLSTLLRDNISCEGDRTTGESISYTKLLELGIKFFGTQKTPSENWLSIEDLTPHFAEFELLVHQEWMEDAATVLREIDEWLLKNGHLETLENLYQRLGDGLQLPHSKRQQIDILARLYHRLGRLKEAIHYYEKGLRIVSELNNQKAQVNYLSNLGVCYEENGDLDVAISHCSTALRISEELKDTSRQAHILNTLSDCWGHIGETNRAITISKQTLDLARASQLWWQVALSQANLGYYYGELGERREAERWCQQALELSRLKDYGMGQAAALTNLGLLHLDQNNLQQAIEIFEEAKQIADQSNRVQLQQRAGVGLALALLYNGNLPRASHVIAEAATYEVRGFIFYALSIQGTIALRQGDEGLATKAFSRAIHSADELLNREGRYYLAVYSNALAYTGLSKTERNNEHAMQTREALKMAKKINDNPGVLKRIQVILRQLGEPKELRVSVTAEQTIRLSNKG